MEDLDLHPRPRVIRLEQDNNDAYIFRDLDSMKGNFTPTCGGLIVFGPQIFNFVVCLIIYIGLGIFLAFQIPQMYESLGLTCISIEISLYLMTLILFILTSVVDPGVIPRELSLTGYRKTNGESTDEIGFRKRYCYKCRKTRPPRTHHCSICGACIRRQDSHFYFGGTCIGRLNFNQYFFLNIFSVLFAAYLICVNIILLHEAQDQQTMTKRYQINFELLKIIISIFVGVLLLVSPQTGACLLVYRIYLLSRDRTMREDWRIFKGYVGYGRSPELLNKSYWKILTNFLVPKPVAISIFRLPKIYRNESYRSTLWWNNIFMPSSQTNHDRTNNVPYANLTDAYVKSGSKNVTIRARDYNANYVNNETPRVKLKNCQSLPVLENGDLQILPGTKLPTGLHEKPNKSLQTKIQLFKQIQATPKSIVNFHMAHPIPCSLSDGSIPRTEPNATEDNALIQVARAAQIQQIISLALARDRSGLVNLARNINVGVLIGLPDLDPDNLQLIEFRDGFPLLFATPLDLRTANFDDIIHRLQLVERNRQLRSNPATHWLGPNQMIAAGLLEPRHNDLLRRLAGHHLPL